MFTLYPTIQEHVLHSNAIEGIHDTHGPLVTSHIHAAMLARTQHKQGDLVHPLKLHQRLAKGTNMESFGGTYRTCSMWVGSKQMPHHHFVPSLMDHWFKLVEELPGGDIESQEEFIFTLHDWFLCIHPFEDGNGRTARLILNALRIKASLPWKIIPSDDRARTKYYQRIRRTEEVFLNYYPEVYEKQE